MTNASQTDTISHAVRNARQTPHFIVSTQYSPSDSSYYGGVAATVAVAAAVVSAVAAVTVAKAVTVTAAVSKTLSPNLALIIAQHKGCLDEIRERCVLILAEH